MFFTELIDIFLVLWFRYLVKDIAGILKELAQYTPKTLIRQYLKKKYLIFHHILMISYLVLTQPGGPGLRVILWSHPSPLVLHY